MKSIELPVAPVPMPVAWRTGLAAVLLLGGMALGMPTAQALSTDKDQPISIEADSVDIDDKKGVSIYRGSVKVRQGSIRLEADRVTVYHPGKKADKLVAVGKPVKFRQRPDNSDKDVKGRSLRLEYFATSEELVLIDQARLEQGSQSFAGDRIVYDRRQAVVKGGAAVGGKERIKIILDPVK